MRLAHERSECDIHGARKSYLAHGKACVKCGLKSRSAIKNIKFFCDNDSIDTLENTKTIGIFNNKNTISIYKNYFRILKATLHSPTSLHEKRQITIRTALATPHSAQCHHPRASIQTPRYTSDRIATTRRALHMRHCPALSKKKARQNSGSDAEPIESLYCAPTHTRLLVILHISQSISTPRLPPRAKDAGQGCTVLLSIASLIRTRMYILRRIFSPKPAPRARTAVSVSCRERERFVRGVVAALAYTSADRYILYDGLDFGQW